MDLTSPCPPRSTRRGFLAASCALGMTLACHSSVAPAAKPPAAAPLYLVVYRAGPGWPPGDGMPPVLREHFQYLLALQRRGELEMAGPFTGERGGAAVFHAADDAAARAWVEADPAVRSQVFQFELRGWSPVDWEKHANPAAR